MDDKMKDDWARIVSDWLITIWGQGWGGDCRQDICIDLKVQLPFLPVVRGL